MGGTNDTRRTGHQGVFGPLPLPHYKGNGHDGSDNKGGNDVGRVPSILLSSPGQAEDDNRHAGKGEEYTDEVDGLELPGAGQTGVDSAMASKASNLHPPIALDLFQRHEENGAAGGQDGQRQVEAKDPAPGLGRLGRQGAADDGPDAIGNGDDGTLFDEREPSAGDSFLRRERHTNQNALILATLAQGNDVADNELGNRHQAAAADAGKGAEDGELQHRLGQRRGQGADEEDGQADEQDELARPNVGQAAVQELADGRGAGERDRVSRRVARTASVTTHMKYPLAIQETWSVEPSEFPIMYKLAASVVWSIRASKSTLAQARKI